MDGRLRISKTIESDDPVAWGSFYGFLSIAIVFLLLPQLFSDNDVSFALGLILLGIFALTLKRWTGAGLLLFSQIVLLNVETQNNRQQSIELGIVWVVLPILLILAVSRFRTIQERQSQSVLRTLAALTSAKSVPPNAKAVSSVLRNFRLAMLDTLRTCVVLIVCGLAALLVMKMVPIREVDIGFNTIREYRLLLLGLTILAVYLVTWIGVSEIIWRMLSPRQASIYLRSVFINYYHRDIRMIILRRMKLRRARSRTIQPVAPDEFKTPANGGT